MYIEVFLICQSTWQSCEPLCVPVVHLHFFFALAREKEGSNVYHMRSQMQIPFINLFQSFCHFTWNDCVCHRKTVIDARMSLVCVSERVFLFRFVCVTVYAECRSCWRILSFVMIRLYRFPSKLNLPFKSISICDWVRNLFIYFVPCHCRRRRHYHHHHFQWTETDLLYVILCPIGAARSGSDRLNSQKYRKYRLRQG